ncbi:MAG: hypothetical protein IPJ27_16565 [Candidatus Accumulibacter sp.]|uniref:DUF7901 domain-containing protein n=1 Tax=Candidatus Accumulibacter proximus TaxID=2954385 RepID=A0A935PZF1_9PROT|nr:hypothetical protein [Candidatus Accumulibacter proximus]
MARTLLPLALAASLIGAASAAVVFEQAPADGNDAFLSISAAQSADGFVLSTTTSVTGLTWWGSYLEDPGDPATPLRKDDFTVRFFADDGSGAPKALPTETILQQPARSSTLLVDKERAPVYRFDLDLALAPVTLAAGRNYLSVVNQFDVLDSRAEWYWLLSDTTGQNFYRVVDRDPWSRALNPPKGNLAFQVSGNPGTAIPVPGSLLLVLSGLAGLNLVGLRGRGELAASPVEG